MVHRAAFCGCNSAFPTTFVVERGFEKLQRIFGYKKQKYIFIMVVVSMNVWDFLHFLHLSILGEMIQFVQFLQHPHRDLHILGR